MQRFSLPKLILAVGLIIAGALFASQFRGAVEQVIIMVTASITAIFIITHTAAPRIKKANITSSVFEPEQKSLTEHPDFDSLIAGISYPILIIHNDTNSHAMVSHANDSAIKLLGEHIIGEDVRTVIRHPAASERLANPDTVHIGEPVLLSGIGTANQKWEMRASQVGDSLKLVHLSDQSGNHAAEQMRVDFVANASHELRTPLASIKGYLETLEDPDAGDDPKIRNRFLKIMVDETNRMQSLITDLMSLSRIEAEKYRAPETQVDLGKLIKEVQKIFIEGSDKRGSDIVAIVPENLPPVVGDNAQLSQLLHNLVSNAMKYGESGTPVEITVEETDSHSMLRLTVADHGEGIPPEHLPRLTQRFYRVDSGRSKSVGGTGLGLSIVKHIVERHRGRIDIRSKMGMGTQIMILLPVYSSSSA